MRSYDSLMKSIGESLPPSIIVFLGLLISRKGDGVAVGVFIAEAHEEDSLHSPDIELPLAAPLPLPLYLFFNLSHTFCYSFTYSNMCSPDGPSSIFAIGPFAHETQLVSTFESTAPFTPESTHLIRPSSPEVPFAQVLLPSLQKAESDNQCSFPNDYFQSYQFYPCSPISHLISPRPVISRSGSSSRLPDCDFASSGSQFSNFPLEVPPTLLDLDKCSIYSWQQRRSTDSYSQDSIGFKSSNDFVLNPQISESMSDHHATNESQNTRILIDGSLMEAERRKPVAANHRFSFELSDADALLRSVGSKTLESNELASCIISLHEPFETAKENSPAVCHTSIGTEEYAKTNGEHAHQHQEHHSLTLGFVKEFNFDHGNGCDTLKPYVNSDWWTMQRI
ncbi:hypothetical protein SDJN03_24766, partial [Cucurbita argyrosperma subsp. sororia]